MRVLIIEDEVFALRTLQKFLEQKKFNVESTDLGQEGMDLGVLYQYDIIILDLNLPDIHGLEVLRKLRNSRVKTPILIISGDDDIETKIKGLGLGADDYVTKPYKLNELLARIYAIIRRTQGHSQSLLSIGRLTIDLEEKMTLIDGKPVHLTKKEYQFLEILCLRKGTTITKEMFLNHIYGGIDEPELKIIDVFICKIRKKLQFGRDEAGYIKTVWGRGYLIRTENEQPVLQNS